MTSVAVQGKIELGKFFQLFGEGVQSLNMPSRFIDSVWHDLLHKSDEYKSFCNHHAGEYVGHAPNNGKGVITWVKDYEHKFGELPPVWFMDSDGSLDAGAYDVYKTTGKWVSSWDCGPKSEPKK